MVPPFSVLDARQGYWQDRKREWLAMGMRSELGREAGLIGSDNVMSQINDGTSVFDPVLCEIAYRWFTPHPGARILDPFAGGVVRGAVAARLGFEYVGIELRPEQVEANRAQAYLWEDCDGPPPVWIEGDARDVASLAPGTFDLVFSCPPYADLEVYSDDPKDLSGLDPDEFLPVHAEIVQAAISKLNKDRFIVWVISEVRNSRVKGGPYLGFVPSTIDAMVDAGAAFYNEAILVNAVGTVSLRAPRQFDATRKLGRAHQNVVIGFAGDSDGIPTLPDDVALDDPEYVDLQVTDFAERRHLPPGHAKMLTGFNGDPAAVGDTFDPVIVDSDPAEQFGEVL
ncbi:MAG: class I SAM-dependent methyltransferase [Acidimicrobiia bacterium]|nr:class I SAM-dependent methyltransferase [Acidimicrobiia bacterium]